MISMTGMPLGKAMFNAFNDCARRSDWDTYAKMYNEIQSAAIFMIHREDGSPKAFVFEDGAIAFTPVDDENLHIHWHDYDKETFDNINIDITDRITTGNSQIMKDPVNSMIRYGYLIGNIPLSKPQFMQMKDLGIY